MTPEDILRDLRDIHLPDPSAEATASGFVFWPIAFALSLVLIAIGLLWWRRSTWRREIARHLDRIERTAGEGRAREAWIELAILLRRTAMRLSDREDVAGLIGDAWLESLDKLFKTDVFADGPGRGVIVFPYVAEADRDLTTREKNMAADLRATIGDVRKHLSSLRTVQ